MFPATLEQVTEEVDIFAVNEPENKIAFLGCKWRSLSVSSVETFSKPSKKKPLL
jgi:hypothetical protein